MADNTIKPRPADATRVNIYQPNDLLYWCPVFQCTEDELREAVRNVGVLAGRVKVYFDHQRKQAA